MSVSLMWDSVNIDVTLRDWERVRSHLQSSDPERRAMVISFIDLRPHVLLDGFTMEADLTAQEQKKWAKDLCNHHYSSFHLWADIVRALPKGADIVAERFLKEFSAANSTYNKHGDKGFGSDWTATRVVNIVEGMKLFVEANPSYSVPFLTYMFRSQTKIRFISQFIRGRQINWKPHLRTIQHRLMTSLSVASNDVRDCIESGLWKYWLESCLTKVRQPMYVLQLSIGKIPPEEATHWQEKFFRARNIEISMAIAKAFPESPGPGRNHIRVMEIHDQ